MNKQGQSYVVFAVLIIAAVLLIGGLVTIVIFFAPSPQSIIPETCSSEQSGTTTSSYTCPSASQSCDITASYQCNDLNSSLSVIARTDDYDLTNGWIAYNNGYGGLNSYVQSGTEDFQSQLSVKDSRIESSSILANIYIDRISTGKLYIYKGAKQVPSEMGRLCSGSSCSQSSFCARSCAGYIQCSGSCVLSYQTVYEYYSYSQGFGADIRPEPLHNCQNLESCGAGSRYSCSRDVTNPQGQKLQTVTYSGSQPGQAVKSFIINGGQRVLFNGNIAYTERIVKQSECTHSVQGSTPYSYFECYQDEQGCGVLRDTETYCEDGLIFDEDAQDCVVPYTLLVTTSKQVFSVGEPVTGRAEITDSSQKAFIEITATLHDNLGTPRAFVIGSTNANGKYDFSIPTPGLQVGQYTLKVKANHPDGQFEVSKPVSLAQPIAVRINPYPDQIQYTVEPIQAKVFVTDDQGNPEDAKSWDLSGTKCGTTDLKNNVQIQRLSRGEYLLKTPVTQECNFVYQVVAIDDSGFRSAPASTTIFVKSSEIVIKPDLAEIQDQDAGRHTITFRTLNPSLQPIDTTNQVVIIDSDGCESGKFCLIDNENKPYVIVAGDNGEYSFSYNYKDGLTTIRITSTAPGIQSSTQEYTVNLFPGDSQDPTGGDEDSNLFFGLTIGTLVAIIIAIVGIVLFIYFVVRR